MEGLRAPTRAAWETGEARRCLPPAGAAALGHPLGQPDMPPALCATLPAASTSPACNRRSRRAPAPRACCGAPTGACTAGASPDSWRGTLARSEPGGAAGWGGGGSLLGLLHGRRGAAAPAGGWRHPCCPSTLLLVDCLAACATPPCRRVGAPLVLRQLLSWLTGWEATGGDPQVPPRLAAAGLCFAQPMSALCDLSPAAVWCAQPAQPAQHARSQSRPVRRRAHPPPPWQAYPVWRGWMWAGILALFAYIYAIVHHQLFWCDGCSRARRGGAVGRRAERRRPGAARSLP